MYISNKIKNIFHNLNNDELKQILQLMMDEKPEESGLLSLQENGLINKLVETTNEQPNEEWFEIFQLEAGGKKRCTDEHGPCSCTKNQIIKCENN